MSWWFVYWQESNFQACLKPEPVHLEEQHDQDTHYLPWNESFDSNYNTRRFHVSSSHHVKSSNWVREQGRRLHVNSCSVTISRPGQQLFWTTTRVSNISILRLSPLKWSFCLSALHQDSSYQGPSILQWPSVYHQIHPNTIWYPVV